MSIISSTLIKADMGITDENKNMMLLYLFQNERIYFQIIEIVIFSLKIQKYLILKSYLKSYLFIMYICIDR